MLPAVPSGAQWLDCCTLCIVQCSSDTSKWRLVNTLTQRVHFEVATQYFDGET
jgi:hypothetical protein